MYSVNLIPNKKKSITKNVLGYKKAMLVLLLSSCCFLSQSMAQCKKIKTTGLNKIEENIKRMDSILICSLLENEKLEIEVSPQEADSIFLSLINHYRNQNGLKGVVLNSCLDSASSLHSSWQSKYFTMSHIETAPNKDGKLYANCLDRVQRYNITQSRFNSLKENVNLIGTIGTLPNSDSKKITKETIDKIFKAWQKSPSHNEAMLSPDITIIGFSTKRSFNQLNNMVGFYSTLVMAKL